MEYGNYVGPYRSKKASVYFKGKRTQHVINTHTSTSRKPGETLIVQIPRGFKDELIVPGSVMISFDMEVSPDTLYLVNNLAASIISQYTVKIGTETIYDLNYAYLYNAYKDMWLSKDTRKNSIFKGIQSTSLRNRRTNLTSDVTLDVDDEVARDIFKNRYIIPLDFDVISNHMPLSEHLQIIFELKINTKEYVLNYLPEKHSSADFIMNNICLEFETVKDENLLREITRGLTGGVSYLFDHVHHYKKYELKKKDDLINVDISGISRRSLKGILLIFEDDFEHGQRNADRFVNPRIKKIELTIDGNSNALYNKGYKEENQWSEICRHFMPEDSKQSDNTYINLKSYYGNDKFALWIDLLSTQDSQLHGTGKIQTSDKNDVTLAIQKKREGNDENARYFMHAYIVSDARINIENKELKSFDL